MSPQAALISFFALALVGSAFGQAPPDAAKPSDNGVAPDAIAAGRRWIAGDPTGRKTLEDMARAGRADAAEMLGELLSIPSPNISPDEVAACGWFAKAASTRSDGLHSLAFCTEKGVGGAPDPAKAAALYAQAAAQGSAKSMCALGNLYIAGEGVPKDVSRGAALCRKAADLGEPDAETDLGNLYLRGVGVPHDMVQARHWYELAAAKGQPNAEFVLGQIYWNGDGVARDQAKAAELWKAAYQGGRTDGAALLADWTFANWMSAHRAGDLSGLDEAISWGEAARKAASDDKARGEADDRLKLMRAIREESATREK